MNQLNANKILLVFFLIPSLSYAELGQGIYLSQATLYTDRLEELIKDAVLAKIDTFVIDIDRPGPKYADRIAKVKAANIKYVARVVVFPGGGNAELIKSKSYWESKYNLAKAAVEYGASEIQLDYIRYASKNKPSRQNALDVYEVIKWFKAQLAPQKIPLQIDVFGIALLGESKYIGQDVKLFADAVDVMCPMTYPSHYEPYLVHSRAPYKAVKGLLDALNQQFDGKPPFRIHPYIEVSNYRYSMSNVEKQKYIRAQIQAVKDAGAQGWYAWSPTNKYGNLFAALKNTPSEMQKGEGQP